MFLEKEIEFVLKSEKVKQYEYFIKKVADFEEVWSLRDSEGWATLEKDGKDYFPVWPKKEFADICVTDEWEGYYPEAIRLDEFIESWIDGLKNDNIRITIMWNNGRGIDVEWDSLKDDIVIEMEKYE